MFRHWISSANHTGAKAALLALLIFLVLALPVYLLAFQLELSRALDQEAGLLQGQLLYRSEAFEKQMSEFKRDVLFLSQTPPISGIIRAANNNGYDPKENNDIDVWRDRLGIIFSRYIENNPAVLQVRYIGVANNGREIVRSDRVSGSAVILMNEQLQEKGGRDYFLETIKRQQGDIYISEINLNQEHGVVEIPHKPTLRVATPIFENDARIFGVVIFNIDARFLFQNISQSLPDGHFLYLLNKDNDFLIHPDQSKTFGFDLGALHRWQDEFKLTEQRADLPRYIHNQQYMYAYKKVFVLDASVQSRTLTLVMSTTEERLVEKVRNRAFGALGGLAGVILIMGVILYFYLLMLKQRLQANLGQARLAAIVNSSSEAVIGVTLSGEVSDWNKAAELMFGFAEKEALGKKLNDLIMPPEQREEAYSTLEKVRDGVVVSHFDTWRKRKDGRLLDVSVASSPIKSDSGDIVGAAFTIRDISEQVVIRNQVMELNANLELKVKQRTEELLEAKEMAEKASLAKSEFVANMSHEIRTPMNAIIGMLQLLKMTKLSGQQADYVDKTNGAARSLLSILNDILDFSKVEAGKLTLDPHPFNLDTLMSEVSAIMSANLGEKNLELIFNIDPRAPINLIGDSLRLKQVLLNLVSNSIKFTNEGEIILSVRPSLLENGKATLVFAVSDTGIGISDEHQKLIFDGFSQAETSTTRNYGGTGLGLAICQRLVNLMGGEIKVESKPGLGSTFKFTADFSLQKKNALEACNSLPLSKKLQNLQVLVVDDNEQSRVIVSGVAKSLGWNVKIAPSAEDAIQKLRESEGGEEQYDVIFMDYSMPGMNGMEASYQIKKLAVINQRPLIIMMTAHGREVLNTTGIDYKTVLDGFIVKPITASMLLDSVVEAQAEQLSRTAENVSVSPNEAHDTGKPLQGLRILLVEDNTTNQQVASELLNSVGAKVEVVGTGKWAVEAVKKASPQFDAVLMDIQMPDMDGYAATKEIRNRLNERDLPIIAMTANALPADRELCLSAGMNEHVGKPFDLEALIKVVLRCVRPVQNPEDIIGESPVLEMAIDSKALFALGWRYGFDIQSALKRFGANANAYSMAIKGFKLEVEKANTLLFQINESSEKAQAARSLHTFKGIAGTVGAKQLESVTRELEQAVNEGAVGPELQALFKEKLAEALSGTDIIIENFSGALNSDDINLIHSYEDLRKGILELALLVGNRDMSAMSLFETLKSKHARRMPEYFSKLEADMGRLDFQAVLGDCTDMLKKIG
ncbi:response regulator [Hahella sp. CR1]|uniref:response regulator n=1 Tax=Hahella sp. CR1 TaxID=2992807 RepID=UPI002442CE33|nr:response regulator [Hahella sp. CR1]MDG9669625.1 response regulator [Hahella sp. CR1]